MTPLDEIADLCVKRTLLLVRIGESRAELLICEQRISKLGVSLTGGRRLSSRELQVACYLGEGLGGKMIAAKMGITQKTVGVHKTNISLKLGVHGGLEIASWYHRHH